ncbi:MAG: hypothetical protein ISS48_00155 [Candidatus Aenigmarchaeota archaeon]|nr:hypothetical protein [Candidatus Aenigmarchaeota archaeon]
MKKEILLGGLTLVLILYIFFVGVPVIKFENEKRVIQMKPEENKFSKNIQILLPAVDEDEKGTMAQLTVQISEGEGRTLLQINDIIFWEDTQESIRIAKSVAEDITGIDTSKYNIIYSVDANASKIEGPSAGPAMAIATSIGLKNKNINTSVVISGYLREDGKIEKVSGILSKARVAKENGIKLFIIPQGQAFQTKLETEEVCTGDFLTKFCETKTIEKKVDIQEEIGIDVIEVESISEALEYFIID